MSRRRDGESGRETGWIDVSVPLDPGRLVVWPGDPPLRTWLVAGIDPDPRAGSPANVSAASLCLHAGTHLDAPCHYLPGGPAVEAIPLETCVGRARLVRHPHDRHLEAADLASLGLEGVERLLLATTNGARSKDARFHPDYVALRSDAARWVVGAGIRLVGIDYLSIGPLGPEGEEVHRILLEAGVVVLEGLVLADLPAGDYELIALPLAVKGSDGGPVRAAVRPLR